MQFESWKWFDDLDFSSIYGVVVYMYACLVTYIARCTLMNSREKIDEDENCWLEFYIFSLNFLISREKSTVGCYKCCFGGGCI